jgi:hypothetical protein
MIMRLGVPDPASWRYRKKTGDLVLVMSLIYTCLTEWNQRVSRAQNSEISSVGSNNSTWSVNTYENGYFRPGEMKESYEDRRSCICSTFLH